MTAFEIVCPGCHSTDTLRYKVSKTTYFQILARPKLKKPTEGTIELGAGFQLDDKARTTECIEPGCGWSQSGPPTYAMISRSALIQE